MREQFRTREDRRAVLGWRRLPHRHGDEAALRRRARAALLAAMTANMRPKIVNVVDPIDVRQRHWARGSPS